MAHKVFVSYHHNNDQYYREHFERLFSTYTGVFISKSVQIGEIKPYLFPDTVRQKIRDEYLRDSTVTVVLIGTETWQRKHVDWEISSSIRQTMHSSRSGLMGIILPTHPSFGTNTYHTETTPPRFVKNQMCGYADIYDWSMNASSVARWIEIAYQPRSAVKPDNSYPHFVCNKSGSGWT